MTRQFTTMRQAIKRLDELTGEGMSQPVDKVVSRERSTYRNGQTTGQVVMLDHACPGDPQNAVAMMLVAAASGILVRVPLTGDAIKALLDFARTDGVRR